MVEARQARRGPAQRVAIGRVWDGAIDHAFDTDGAEGRHATTSVLDILLEPVSVIVKQLVRKLDLCPSHSTLL